MHDITLTIPVERIQQAALTRRAALIALAVAGACLAFVIMSQFVMWYLAILLLLAWSPLLYQHFRVYFVRSIPLGVLFALVVLQGVHFSEHVSQMVQIHLLGRAFSMSHGILGAFFDVEVFHFFFDTLYIPTQTGILLIMYGRRVNWWLCLLLPVAAWHGYEHIVIMGDYLRTGIVGTPGLLATGGHLWHNSPISRPDLHFWYNFVEEVLIVLAFLQQIKER